MSTLTVPRVLPPAAQSATVRGYRICQRCIMDTSDPEIRFDEHGSCNHCQHYERRAAAELLPPDLRAQRLAALVERIRREGRRKPYDCLIGVSGGVDSTTVAYHVRRLGLRPLALHLDNGWNSELAVHNIHHTLNALQIDLHTHVIEWHEFRDLQLSFLRASVPNCEIPTDHAINALLINTACKLGIRYILNGSNLVTEGILPHAWVFYNQDLRHLRAIHRQFGSVRLRTLPQISLPRFVSAILLRGVRYIPILNYLDYQKEEAKQLIQRELGWRDYGGKHYESIYTRFYQGYILPVKFGFDKRRAHLSTLICSGQLSREAALEEIRREPYDPAALNRDREFVVKKLGLTPAEFEAIMQAPPKQHADYPSNRFFFHELRGLRERFKAVATARV
jgi:N-acetyl sugar amidotransferase